MASMDSAPTLETLAEPSPVPVEIQKGSSYVPTTRDDTVAVKTVSKQPYEIVEPVLRRDNLQGDDSLNIVCHPETREARMSGNGDKPHVNASQFVLFPRVLTCSERNFTRLRIWLACHAYKSFGYGGVHRFGPRSVLKFTAVTRVAEAANIEYIGLHTTIPVPRIQDVFIIGDRTYIVMDYINGSELTPKAGRLEAADGNGLFDIRLDSKPFPPFASVEEFHARLGHEFILKSPDHRDMWSHFGLISQRRYSTVFTHSDIAPRNILIKDGKIAAIVDWGSAGWYPEYWEYTQWAVNSPSRMWLDLRDDVLDPYPDELKVDEYLDSVFTRL